MRRSDKSRSAHALGGARRGSWLRASYVEPGDDVEGELCVDDYLDAGALEAEDVAGVGVVDVGA